MEDKNRRTFFIGLHEKNGLIVAHEFRDKEPGGSLSIEGETAQLEQIKTEKNPDFVPDPKNKTFSSVITSFISVMSTYRDFVAFMLELSPALSVHMAASTVGEFAKRKGVERPDLAVGGCRYYELNFDSYREFSVNHERVMSGLAGVRHLPEVMVMGLISAYDAYLSRLLRVILDRHEEIVLTSEKTIKFSELAAFGSVEAARDALINREVESVIRSSHHEQFIWMEKSFSIKLRVDLPAWPRFVELCERRNLITHTGGVVSPQYIQNCKANGFKADLPPVGTKLKTDIEYFRSAVRTVHEIGLKLGHVLWRKFALDQQKNADIELNEHALDLIIHREYQLAEQLLTFGVKTIRNHPSDNNRRMMVINRANSIRLQDRKSEAVKILDDEDWSASKNKFSICVAAVKGDVEGMVRLMREDGTTERITAEDYRSWPVFRGLQSNEIFTAAFEEIFAEPFTKGSSQVEKVLDSQTLAPQDQLH